MNLIITGRHMSVTDAMKAYATEKLTRLERYNDMIHEVEVVLNIEGDRHVAEMICHAKAGGNRVFGKAEHSDMYAAIDLLVEKMERQLKTHKEKVKTERKHSARHRHETVRTAQTVEEGGAEEIEELGEEIAS